MPADGEAFILQKVRHVPDAFTLVGSISSAALLYFRASFSMCLTSGHPPTSVPACPQPQDLEPAESPLYPRFSRLLDGKADLVFEARAHGQRHCEGATFSAHSAALPECQCHFLLIC